MHYGKVWKRDIDSLCTLVRSWSIDYKDWKKHMKYHANDLIACWKSNLESQCKRLDENLFSRKRFSWVFWQHRCLSNNLRLNDVDVVRACLLNRQTVYKVCKKLQRHLHVPAMQWYTASMSNHVYKFMGSGELTEAMIKCGEELICPVCIEKIHKCETSIKNVLALRCGHVICTDCALHMWGVHNSNGTMYNLLAFANAHGARCPVCREKNVCSSSSGARLIKTSCIEEKSTFNSSRSRWLELL